MFGLLALINPALVTCVACSRSNRVTNIFFLDPEEEVADEEVVVATGAAAGPHAEIDTPPAAAGRGLLPPGSRGTADPDPPLPGTRTDPGPPPPPRLPAAP
eukprot:Phypoly_transcript_08752.p3 GENE.Phypoly_transcript_08752~~Phypoly_transcript_08752.p3  ORF type:complete len:101 (-),score=13.47 Phypoly_transcript_08752:275-577(-)